MATTIGRRLDRALLALHLKAQGPAVDTTRDQVTGSKPDSPKPPAYGDEAAIWFDRAQRLAEAIERELDGVQVKPPRKTTGDLIKVIHEYEGRDPIYVAFIEGCSEALVRKVRTMARLEPSNGFKQARPLTSRQLPEATDG